MSANEILPDLALWIIIDERQCLKVEGTLQNHVNIIAMFSKVL